MRLVMRSKGFIDLTIAVQRIEYPDTPATNEITRKVIQQISDHINALLSDCHYHSLCLSTIEEFADEMEMNNAYSEFFGIILLECRLISDFRVLDACGTITFNTTNFN